MDVAQALGRLMQDSSQVQRVVVLDAGGAVLGSTLDDAAAAESLAEAARGLLSAAGELRASGDEVMRAEVELSEGALFVLREGGWTIAATTGPKPTAGLVAYDLRTCLHGLGEAEKPKRKRTTRKAKEEAADG